MAIAEWETKYSYVYMFVYCAHNCGSSLLNVQNFTCQMSKKNIPILFLEPSIVCTLKHVHVSCDTVILVRS